MPAWWKRSHILVLAGLVVFHLVLISIQVPLGSETKYFERAVFFVFSPVQKGVVSAFRGLQSVWTNYFDLRRVREDNQRLKQELFFLNQEKRFLEDRLLLFRSEAEVRDNLAAFRSSLIAARVIGADAGNYYRSLIVNKGSLDGVKPDMAVCDRLGNLVGRTISPVSLNEAMVQLITDQESSVSVISAADRIVGIMSGTQGTFCVLKYILSSMRGGQEGEDLITTGFDKIYPAGLRVGQILSIKPTPSVFKEIVVKPYFSFSTLDAVAILPRVSGGAE
ncbi:MAG: rod shape-determining protein MreC [Acidobacteriota bacterium]